MKREELGMELDRERAEMKENMTKDFVTLSVGQDMVGAEMEKSESHCNAPELTRLVEDNLIDKLQFGYHAPKKGVKTPFLF